MEHSLDEFIDSLNLDYEFKKSGESYVAILNNSDEFSDAYNTVSLNKNLHAVDNQTVTESKTSFTFTDGYNQVRLFANYDSDLYKIIIEER